MTYLKKPENFNPRFEIVSCFIMYDGKILLLHRNENKSQGNRWGLPAGKVENGESIKNANVREVKEETGIDIEKENVDYLGETYHHHGNYDFVFHTFYIRLNTIHDVKINFGEHEEFIWKTPAEVLTMKKEEIVEDFDDVLKLFYSKIV